MLVPCQVKLSFLGRDGKVSAPGSVQPMLFILRLANLLGFMTRMHKGACDSFYAKHLDSISLMFILSFLCSYGCFCLGKKGLNPFLLPEKASGYNPEFSLGPHPHPYLIRRLEAAF